jgi:hypothetical protein
MRINLPRHFLITPLFSGLLSHMGCSAVQDKEMTRNAAQPNQTLNVASLALTGYNYTNKSIDGFTVDGLGRGTAGSLWRCRAGAHGRKRWVTRPRCRHLLRTKQRATIGKCKNRRDLRAATRQRKDRATWKNSLGVHSAFLLDDRRFCSMSGNGTAE